MQISYVYIIECSDGTYYVGVTNDVFRRFEQHESGKNPESYTYKRRPLKLVFYAGFTDISMAIEKEKQIKKWSRAKKLALIESRFNDLPNLSKKRFDK